ncbi:MAG: PEP-CTERM sorting domain-containing protein [bacterium]|nr:PEP-CTERM sorting domain-containing protein [bacterium]
MSKRQRHERKKTERARRRRAVRNGAAALAAATAIAAGTQAYADPVRFDNPAGSGHFDWFGPPISNRYLDITLPAAGQTPTTHSSLPNEFWHSIQSTSSIIRGADGGAGSALQATGYYNYMAAPFTAAQLIPDAGFAWASLSGYVYNAGYGGSELPEGVPTYLGVRFDPGDGNHYGWFGVVRTGMALDAFAWGYETEANTPIPAGAPEPGTLALLAFGAVGVVGRRRRTSSH